jgi:2-dehydro-3-deoxygalactonokinase
LIFIRGVKNRYPSDASFKAIRHIDFMRGEETQVMGLLSLPGIPAPPFTVVVLSSHTKYIPVTPDGRIAGSLTTLSGQVFEAVRQNTSVGKSIEAPDPAAEALDEDVIDTAVDAVRHAGFLRALLMPRFMEVLLRVPAAGRRLFLEAAIAAEDVRVLADFPLLGFPMDTPFILIGPFSRCRIFQYLLARHARFTREVRAVSDAEEVDRLSILGAVAIAQRAGHLTGSQCHT